MRVFIKVLQEVEPQFIAEQHSQQLRKLLLEMIHRIPTNEHLKPHVKPILALMFRLIGVSIVAFIICYTSPFFNYLTCPFFGKILLCI